MDAVSVPLIAADGISDGRGIAASFALGAAGVQLGTAYLLCPEVALPGLQRDVCETSGHTKRSDERFHWTTGACLGKPVGSRSRSDFQRCADFPLPMGC